MDSLPLDIEQKLEALPFLPFDINEEFQAMINSDLYSDIFTFYKNNYLPDTLNTKPELYQRISLYLTLTGQNEDFLEQTDDILYRRPIPTIEEFLDGNYYMGLQNGTMYPYWKKQLCEIFKPDSIIKRVLWSGGTGTGKTVTARKAVIYSLYKIFCLRYPRAVLNVETGSTLAVFVLSVTQKNAYQTNFEPFINIISNMPCFQRVRNMTAFENFDISNPNCPIPFYVDKANLTIVFMDNIILTIGSQISNTVGYDVIISACFTANNKVHTNLGVKTFKQLLTDFKNKRKIQLFSVDAQGQSHISNLLDIKKTGERTKLIRLYSDEKNYIECTPEHRFVIKNPNKLDKNILCEDGLYYKEAQYLTEDDDVLSISNSYVYALIDNRPFSKNFNKPFYIGIGSSINATNNITKKYERAYYHFSKKALKEKHNLHKINICKDILTHNLNPEVKILKENISLEEAFSLEKQYITLYGKSIDKTGILTNLTDGGEGTILTVEQNIKKGL